MKRADAPRDPVALEIDRGLFVSLCEEMGVALMRTAASPNIKERRDYSCALFDARGRTVAQGDHMPVHLGSMPASVEAAIGAFRLGPGDVVLLNDPFSGGTHLPDLTVVAPVFSGGRVLFHLANRAHHSDVGGIAPGSMPPARDIHQEGLVIPPVRLVRAGEIDRDIIAMILANSRTPSERSADLHAQLSALRAGERRVQDWVGRRGASALARSGSELQDYARRAVGHLLARLPRGEWRFEDRLDGDGWGGGEIRLKVRLALDGKRATVDLRENRAPAAGTVNAVAAITRSAVYYVFRCLLTLFSDASGSAGETPWNAGSFDAINVLLHPGSILDARRPASVAGGNVETSQRIVDLLLGALARALPGQIPAASQGTMNNVSFGGVRRGGAGGPASPFTYYETIAGGMGARPRSDGLSGVHTHMTNSLNTPIEALEATMPVTVERYTIRRGSGGFGGAGGFRGGDGIERILRFGVPVDVSVISERRTVAPWGLAGGRAGARGTVSMLKAGSSAESPLPSKGTFRFGAGDALVVRTPGGGGHGRARRKSTRQPEPAA